MSFRSIASTWKAEINIFLFFIQRWYQCHKCCQFSISLHYWTRWQSWLGTGPSNTVNNPEAEPHKCTCFCDSAGWILFLWVNLSAGTTYHRLNIFHLEHQAPESSISCSFNWKQTTLNYKLLFSKVRSSISGSLWS